MTQEVQTAPRTKWLSGRRIAIAGAAALGIAALGATAVYSQPNWGGGWGPGMGWGQGHGQGQGYGPGQGQGYGPGQGHGGWGHGGGWGHHGGRHGMMGGGMFGFGAMGRIDAALSSVGASAEQKEKIFAIGRQAMTDLMPLRDRRFVARTKLQEIMKAPTVDRAAIEKLRAEEFAAYDAGSKRAAQALADAAEVLNAQQRQQLIERMEARRRWWRG
jgi:Spy/CpxP family protein refolding chaperone